MYQFNQQPYYGQQVYQPMGQPGMNMYGMPNAYAYYGAQQPNNAQLFKNYLTPEQMAELQMNPETFNTKLSRREYLGAICLHKNEQSQSITLEQVPDGKHRCSICQAEFHLLDPNTDINQIRGICTNMVNLLQSIKTYSLQPSEELRNIFMMIGFVEKLPYLWEKTVKAFDQACPSNNFNMPQQGQNVDMFQALGSVFGAGIVPGNGFNNGMLYQQPQPVPQMAMYSQPGFAPQPTPGLPQAPVQQPVCDPNQQYGFSPQAMVQQPQGVPANGYQQPPQTPPPPPGYPNPASNPIGYVESNQMTTQNIQIGGQQPAQQPVTPQPQANPNIQPPPPVAPSANKK